MDRCKNVRVTLRDGCIRVRVHERLFLRKKAAFDKLLIG